MFAYLHIYSRFFGFIKFIVSTKSMTPLTNYSVIKFQYSVILKEVPILEYPSPLIPACTNQRVCNNLISIDFLIILRSHQQHQVCFCKPERNVKGVPDRCFCCYCTHCPPTTSQPHSQQCSTQFFFQAKITTKTKENNHPHFTSRVKNKLLSRVSSFPLNHTFHSHPLSREEGV